MMTEYEFTLARQAMEMFTAAMENVVTALQVLAELLRTKYIAWAKTKSLVTAQGEVMAPGEVTRGPPAVAVKICNKRYETHTDGYWRKSRIKDKAKARRITGLFKFNLC